MRKPNSESQTELPVLVSGCSPTAGIESGKFYQTEKEQTIIYVRSGAVGKEETNEISIPCLGRFVETPSLLK